VFNQALLENNFLTKGECKSLINFYMKNEPSQFYNTSPLLLELENHFNLVKKINKIGMKLNNSVIDYFEIVKRPAPSTGQRLHFDTAHSHTSLSSIIYLNEGFAGGHTVFEDGTSFAPVTGRAIFFDGQYFRHGVSPIQNKDRYTIATWFKKNEY